MKYYIYFFEVRIDGIDGNAERNFVFLSNSESNALQSDLTIERRLLEAFDVPRRYLEPAFLDDQEHYPESHVHTRIVRIDGSLSGSEKDALKVPILILDKNDLFIRIDRPGELNVDTTWENSIELSQQF